MTDEAATEERARVFLACHRGREAQPRPGDPRRSECHFAPVLDKIRWRINRDEDVAYYLPARDTAVVCSVCRSECGVVRVAA